jgi:predicted dienelactone hydrolase
MTDPDVKVLPAGHRARSAVASALWASVAGAVAFTVFACVTTQVKGVRAGSPWQDDPYDGVVSLTEFLVPTLAVLVVARALLIRRREPQPVFRVTQLLRAAFVCTLLVTATVTTDWLAVVLRADRPLWDEGTPWLIAALVPLTAAAAAGLLSQWRAFHRLPPRDGRRPDGDWLDDLAALIDALAARLPHAGRRLASRLSRGGAIGFVRRHIVAFAAGAGLAGGLLGTTAQALGEDWTSPLLFLTATLIGAGGFFALSMICNTVLQIAVPHGPGRTRPGSSTRVRRSARVAVIAGALAMPISAMSRSGIRPVLGGGGEPDVPLLLAVITFTGAVVITVLVFGISFVFTRPVGAVRAHHGWRAWVRRALNTIVALVLTVMVGSAGYVGAAAVLHAQPVTLPAPSGPYRVGRTAFDWTDHARTDPLAARRGTARELSVWLWYPAAPHASGRRAPYTPGTWGQLHFGSLPGLGETGFGAVRAHALDGVPVAAGRFPIVVFEPGLGLAAPQYTTLAENLASHGYLVAGVTPTYSANLTVLHGHAVHATAAGNPRAFDTADLYPDRAAQAGDRLVVVWATDARFAAWQVAALDRAGRFAGHVDMARTAYLGHSFGGAASLEACRTDPHCKAAVDLDGTQHGPVVRMGLSKPMMIVASQDSCVTGTCQRADTVNLADRDTARALLAAGSGQTWCYQIDGTGHFNFSDYAAYYLAAPIRHLLTMGSIDGDLGLAITNTYLTAFLGHTVQSSYEPLISGKIAPYPQVRTHHTPQ